MLEMMLNSGDTKERCGVIMDDDNVIEIANVAEDPEEGFEMEPQAFLELIKTGRVVATWHTHPDSPPVLSGEDYRTFLAWPDLKHNIIGFENGKIAVSTYRIKDGVVLSCD